MSTGFTPGSFQSLASSTFGAAPQQPAGSVPSGGTVGLPAAGPPAAGGAPLAAPVQYQQPAPYQAPPQYQQPPVAPPAAPVYQQPQPVTPPPGIPGVTVVSQPTQYQPAQIPPQYQQAPAAPAAPGITPQAPVAGRSNLDRMVAEGIISPAEAFQIGDDWNLIRALWSTPPETPSTPAPSVPTPPVVTPAAPIQPSGQSAATVPPGMLSQAPALVQAGLLKDSGGIFTAATAELAPIAAMMNQERMRQIENEAVQKAQQAFNPTIEGLKQSIEALKQQVAQAVPKPHEAWLSQHKDYLWAKDAMGRQTQTRSPAGDVYYRVWNEGSARGISDEAALHTMASTAVEAFWRTTPNAVQQQSPQQQPQTFMQAASAAQLPNNPGFNAPGTALQNQSPQRMLGVTNQGMPDWDYYMNQAVNGNPQNR